MYLREKPLLEKLRQMRLENERLEQKMKLLAQENTHLSVQIQSCKQGRHENCTNVSDAKLRSQIK